MSACQYGFDLRGKQDAIILQGVKQWLDTHPVSGKEQPFSIFFPHPKAKDAVEFLQTVPFPLGVGVQNHFRIRMSPKAMTQSNQFFSHILRII